MSIKINNQDIVAINKGNQVITDVYKGIDLVWQFNTNTDPLDQTIYFADPAAGWGLYTNGLIANSYKSSKRELATITSLNPDGGNTTSYFYYNTPLTKFPELQYCTGLSSLYAAFYYCSNLTEVGIIPESVTDMSYTFSNCYSLVDAPIIPDSVTNMDSTFSSCKLTEAPIIPDSVTNMRYTFSNCISLVDAPIIPDSVTNMDSTFGVCRSLINAPIIPDSVTNMRSTFNGCENLVEAPIIPESVTDMYRTFKGCFSLVDAPIIPDSVTNMTETFSYCISLDGIFIIKPLNPPRYSNTFENVNVVAIYVPDESVDSYKTASGWRDHSSKIKPMSLLP